MRLRRGRASFTDVVETAPVKGRKGQEMDELPKGEGKDLSAHCEHRWGVRCGRGHLQRGSLSHSMPLKYHTAEQLLYSKKTDPIPTLPIKPCSSESGMAALPCLTKGL